MKQAPKFDYAKIFEIWQNNPDDYFHWRINSMAQQRFTPAYQAECEAAYFRLYPRRKKFDWKSLPDEVLQPIKEKWLARAQAWAVAMVVRKELLGRILSALAPGEVMVPTPEMRVIHTISSDTYRSQGMGQYHYTEANAKAVAQMLTEAGFTATIEEQPTSWGGYTFTVTANALPWQLDVLRRRQTRDDIKRRASRNQVNARVDHPFLPYDD